ncbi:MAG: hypothetical protein KIT27_07235 [Legionellales bacterium]|nr:hypothetical protein [Legionellales bacterium]
MLFSNYLILVLKQLYRIKIAFFFTLIFPLILYLLFNQGKNALSLIGFFNFAIQSAMLQSVGMFISASKNTAWGCYVETLPAPSLYQAASIIIGMLLVGILGVIAIAAIDFIIYHTLSLNSLLLALISCLPGALAMGALGYLIGYHLDPMSSRNILVLTNIVFMFLTFTSGHIQQCLSWFFLPNAWMLFSYHLSLAHTFDMARFAIIMSYFLVFLAIIHFYQPPKTGHQY